MVQRGDGQGRRNANVLAIRCVFIDDDGGGKPLPIEPHIVVQTSPAKYHRYILVDDLSAEEFRGVQARLICDYGSDPNARDRARVLRLPGFYHLKNRVTPHLVRIVEESGQLPYSRDELLRALPPVKPRESKRGNSAGEREAVHVDPSVVTELRSALFCMRSDDRDLWVRMGHALKELGDIGQALWLEWSATSEKFNPLNDVRTWDSFKPERTGYQAVFAEAQRHGWVNPSSKDALGADVGGSTGFQCLGCSCAVR
jgi:RepB DNA-primase from phage plasmid/Primase C terminal 2 (PriCT-2)